MFPVVDSTQLGPAAVRLWIRAPALASAWRPGQFAVVRASEGSTRIPCPIVDGDANQDIIGSVVPRTGAPAEELGSLSAGDAVREVSGPYGRQLALAGSHVCCVADGPAAAAVLPIARAAAAEGRAVTAVIGGRTRTRIVLEEEFRAICQHLAIATDDGSYGMRRYVIDVLRDVLAGAKRPFDQIVAAGPLQTVFAATDLARVLHVPIAVGLHPLMVAGPGLCRLGEGAGPCDACRIEGPAGVMSVCQDGPFLDGAAIDFGALFGRLSSRDGKSDPKP